MSILYAADLFAGAGGFSTGLLRAAAAAGRDVDLLAVNHWPTAVETHSRNHPQVVHYCESIEGVDPRKVVPGGRLHLLLASPECTHHSNARGGKPMSDQSRATAWHVLRWAEALYIDHIIVENVKEFQSWGPLNAEGRPIASMKGRLFRQFLSSLRALGYAVDARVLNAADYGDATTRHRLFIQARRGSRRPSWPDATHVRSDGLGLYPDALPWRPAREIIDWGLPSRSVYGRKKPLAPNTMRRIMAGLRKYSGLPFLVGAGGPAGQAGPHAVDAPLGTVLTDDHRCLAQPFLVVLRNHCDALPVAGPLPTLCADGGHVALCEPFVIGQQSGAAPRSTADPLPTVATAGAISFVQPFLVPNFGERQGQSPRTHDVNRPLPAVTGHGAGMLVEPFIVPVTHTGGANRAHNIGDPLPVVTTAHRGELALCEPFLTEFHGGPDGDRRTRPLDRPLCTLDTSNRLGLTQPFLVKYFGTAGATSVDDPLDTVTARDRFALVSPEMVTAGAAGKGEIVGWLDIRFRMLQPHELAASHSFPADYSFAGTRDDQVKQVGNSVGVGQAAALCASALKGLVP